MNYSLEHIEVEKGVSNKRVLNLLNKYGVVKIKGYLNNVSGIKKEVFKAFEKSTTNYAFGKAYRFGPIKKNKKIFPSIYSAFNNKWMREIEALYLYDAKPCIQTLATHDYISDSGLARNGFLHFDRVFAFKFFLYLQDCDFNDGPFSCVPGSHKIGEKLRVAAWMETKKYANVRNRVFIDYNDMQEYKDKIIPITANAGDLVIFDTDMFHMGGLTNGGERLIIRSHTAGKKRKL
jgi:hypothetical protein